MGRYRVLFVLAVAIAGAAFAACDDFTATPPAADAGVDASPVDANVVDVITSSPDVDVPPPPDLDAGPDANCTHCRSSYCETDGGCEPLVFVTAARLHGDFDAPKDAGAAGVVYADRYCSFLAKAPGKFMALVSDSKRNALTALTGTGAIASRPVRRPDGVRVAASYHAIASELTIEAPISITETGGDVTLDEHVWTGTDYHGHTANAGNLCQEWRSNDAGGEPNEGVFGAVTSADGGAWLQVFPTLGQTCNNMDHVYCFEVDETP